MSQSCSLPPDGGSQHARYIPELGLLTACLQYGSTFRLDKVHNPTIVYLERTGSDSLALSFMVRGEEDDTSVKLELIGVDENRGCMEIRERKGVVNYEPTGERLRVEKIAMPEIKKMVNRLPFNEEYVVSAEAPKLLHPPVVYAAERLTRCYLNISPQHETYVKRKLRFIMADTLNSYLLDFTRIQGATSFQLLGGDSGGDERVRRVGRLNEVVASWEDEASAQKRDLWLLVIGMVLGLAGAAILEALRPLISPSRQES